MSLSHALLTSLLEKPASGYELSRRFDRSLGYFWHASHQQIYRELARMEGQGWISAKSIEQESRPTKNVYRILGAGRTELKRWALQPSDPGDYREDLLIKLRADAACGPLELIPELTRRLQIHEQKLAVFLAIEQRDFLSLTEPTRSSQLQHMILKSGIMSERGWIGWCREALAMLKQLDS